jgi:hypothetical protein
MRPHENDFVRNDGYAGVEGALPLRQVAARMSFANGVRGRENAVHGARAAWREGLTLGGGKSKKKSREGRLFSGGSRRVICVNFY